MASRQSAQGPAQYLALAAAAALARTQQPRKHLAVHPSELAIKPNLQILRRYRRSLLLRLEHPRRSTVENHVHRPARLGNRTSANMRIGITRCLRNRVQATPLFLASKFNPLSSEGWRRRRDSNPRYAFGAYNGLANRRLQPLGHVSVPLDMPDSDLIGKQMAPNPPLGASVQCAGPRTFSSPAANR